MQLNSQPRTIQEARVSTPAWLCCHWWFHVLLDVSSFPPSAFLSWSIKNLSKQPIGHTQERNEGQGLGDCRQEAWSNPTLRPSDRQRYQEQQWCEKQSLPIEKCSSAAHILILLYPVLQLLRQNHAFKRLDLSRCFLSENQFVSLAQALAWNSRIEEVSSDTEIGPTAEHKYHCRLLLLSPRWSQVLLAGACNVLSAFCNLLARCSTFPSNACLQLSLQECVFTSVGTAALADVLTVNNHIHSLDVRGCKGERF